MTSFYKCAGGFFQGVSALVCVQTQTSLGGKGSMCCWCTQKRERSNYECAQAIVMECRSGWTHRHLPDGCTLLGRAALCLACRLATFLLCLLCSACTGSVN